MKKPKIIEFLIDETVGDIVDVVSIVDAPAIEIDFLKFKNEKPKSLFKEQDSEKRIVVGPAMIPNKYIYRYDQMTDEEFYGFFSESTIEKAQEMFMKYGSTKSTNLNHNDVFFDGVSVIESWIISDENNDKAYALGYDKKDVPKGSWMVTFKVDNDQVWSEIKKGTFKGFSIEAFLSTMVRMRKINSVENDIENIISSSKTDKEKLMDLFNYIIKIKLED